MLNPLIKKYLKITRKNSKTLFQGTNHPLIIPFVRLKRLGVELLENVGNLLK
jgi:hypothetical protein